MPPGWEQHQHPNGDIYYYHRGLRLITPDDIRDPEKLQHVLDAREDHLQCLNGSVARLPDDWELVLYDVTEEVAVIGMFSRSLGLEYEWTEEHGQSLSLREVNTPSDSLSCWKGCKSKTRPNTSGHMSLNIPHTIRNSLQTLKPLSRGHYTAVRTTGVPPPSYRGNRSAQAACLYSPNRPDRGRSVTIYRAPDQADNSAI